MNVFEFVLGIIVIVTVASLFKMLLNHQRHKLAHSSEDGGRLEQEVQTLSARLAVLERIAVEKENSLERQIESLRDR
ncbi:MAG TPA: hypothetical protein VIA98_04485 [Allosphingosinicella sp.]|jgi:Tfp pilus assembly protein PilN